MEDEFINETKLRQLKANVFYNLNDYKIVSFISNCITLSDKSCNHKRHLIFKDYDEASRFAEMFEIQFLLKNIDKIKKNHMIFEYAQ